VTQIVSLLLTKLIRANQKPKERDIMKATHYTRYSTPRTFFCSNNRFGQVRLISYGRANLEDGTSIEIENPDFGLWSKKNQDVGNISDKLERYPLTRIK